jgi:type IV secretory pathway VirB3-like protein
MGVITIVITVLVFAMLSPFLFAMILYAFYLIHYKGVEEMALTLELIINKLNRPFSSSSQLEPHSVQE